MLSSQRCETSSRSNLSCRASQHTQQHLFENLDHTSMINDLDDVEHFVSPTAKPQTFIIPVLSLQKKMATKHYFLLVKTRDLHVMIARLLTTCPP